MCVGLCHMKCPLLPKVYGVDLSGYGSGGAVVPQVAQRLSGGVLCGMWHRLHWLDAEGRSCGGACGVGLLDGSSLRSRCDLIALMKRLFLVESSVWQAVRSRTILMVVWSVAWMTACMCIGNVIGVAHPACCLCDALSSCVVAL